jgi:hypothetical protein
MAADQESRGDRSSGPQNISTLPSREQLQALNLLIGGYRVSQAIYVAAALNIPDLLAQGPRTSDELAQATGTHAGALYRVLRLLAGVGLCEEVAPHLFGLTSLGAALRADVPGSLRSMALMHLDSWKWEPWGHLLDSVRTGQTAFEQVRGVEVFAYLEEHPETARLFQEAMTGNTARSGRALTQAYDFSGVGHLVDVGGGRGLLLATILREHPAMRGVLFDRPSVVDAARETLEVAGVADRCEIVGGDFFEAVPAGGDAYVLRQVLHDWDDAHAAQILAYCRRAMGGTSGKLLVVEAAIASDYRQALPVLLLDLEMLVNFGGLQRTEDEYQALFAQAGFQLSAVIPLGDAGQFSVFEGTPL